jgi:hypothetical protein
VGLDEEARFLYYVGRRGLVAQMKTPSGVPGYVASVAVLTSVASSSTRWA